MSKEIQIPISEKIERNRIATLNLMEDLRYEITVRESIEADLKKNEEKFRTIFESVGSGLIYLTNTGIIVDVNPGFIELTGYARELLIGSNVVNLAKEVLRKTDIKNLFKALSNTLRGKGVKSFNFSINNRFLSASSFFNKEKNIIIGVVEDLTEWKLAEENLNTLLIRQEAILGSIPDIVMEVSNNKVYTWANKAGYEFFGKEVIGKGADYFFEGEQDVYEIVEPLFKGQGKQIYVESWQRRKDAEKRLLAWWCKTLKDGKGNVIGAISSARDITELKNRELELEKSREQLEQLNLYLQRVREEERKIISRELHDDLGQSLTAIKIDLGSLKLSIDDKKSLKTKIDKLSDLVGDSIVTVRRLTSQLRPLILDDLGLIAAIEWYTSEFSERTGIKINLDLDSEIQINTDHELVIFRILQESLTNIARHSKATKIDISFCFEQTRICLKVIDNGIGITETDLKSSRSFGLLNMRERAREIGGMLEINSILKKGTTIRLVIPKS